MPKFGQRSTNNLSECHPDLIKLFTEVVEDFDCSILCGYRNLTDQDDAYHKGLSKLKYPKSKHNKIPALAVDCVPYPIDWKDTDRMYYFAGFVMGKAKELGIDLRFGGDWDGDTKLKDQTFMDLPHFELRKK